MLRRGFREREGAGVACLQRTPPPLYMRRPRPLRLFCLFPTEIGDCFAAGRRMEMALPVGVSIAAQTDRYL